MSMKGMQILADQVCIGLGWGLLRIMPVEAKTMLIVADQVRLREECVLLRIRSA